MLDTYIRVTAGTARYLLYLLMEFFGPVVRIICWFLSLGGLFAFLIMLVAQSDHPFAQTGMYSVLAAGLLGTALLTYYEIALDRMYIDRLYSDSDDDEVQDVPRWRPALNWFAVFVFLAAFCVVANWLYGLAQPH